MTQQNPHKILEFVQDYALHILLPSIGRYFLREIKAINLSPNINSDFEFILHLLHEDF